MLQAHTIKANHGARKKAGVVGRGASSGWGTTAGRGTKGQKARSGGSHRLTFKGSKALIQSMPKLRGFKSMHKKPVTITLVQLQKNFEDGTIVTHEGLIKAGLVVNAKRAAKIIGNTKVEKKFTVKDLPVSAGAQKAIEAAGGSIDNK